MNRFFRKNQLNTVMGIAALTLSGLVSAESEKDLMEARQEVQIWTTYALSPYLRASDIKVVVDGDKATLSGKVDEDVNKDLAKQIALGVPGIKEVDNQIQVQSDYVAKNTGQNFAQYIDDTSITTAVKSRLEWSKYVESNAVGVSTTGSVVTLTGKVSSADAKAAAGRLAIGTRGVTSVTNKLEVNNSKGASQGSSQPISDAWITTKVKSTFLYSSNVGGSDIEVTTREGVVNLKGKVDSGAERALAIELVQNIRGVKSVSANELTF